MTADEVRAMTDEIESLRAAIAAKDEVLQSLRNSLDLSDAPHNTHGDRWLHARYIEKIDAALSSTPPSGMVCVPVERLREIAIDAWMECPVCGTPCEYGHAPDCWLSALLGGDDE